MEKKRLENELYKYRLYFKNRWKQPYPNKIDKDYFKFYTDVLKGKALVLQLEKFDADGNLPVESLTQEQAENIFA